MNTHPGIYLNATPPYVRGAFGRAYDLTGGIKAVDKYLEQLSQIGALPSNEDYDLLLDARVILAAREEGDA